MPRRARATVFALGLVLALLAACPEDEPDACFIGDPALPAEIELVVMQVGGGFVPIVEGGSVPIMKPPQGGKVIAPGVLARNLDGCGLTINASLRDECTGKLLGVEQRPINLRARADGWGEPQDPVQLSNYSNLATCPRPIASRDVEDEPYLLAIKVTDKRGRVAERSVHVVPVCAEPENAVECRCECDADYALGDMCSPEPDGGPTPGTCPDDAGVGEDGGR